MKSIMIEHDRQKFIMSTATLATATPRSGCSPVSYIISLWSKCIFSQQMWHRNSLTIHPQDDRRERACFTVKAGNHMILSYLEMFVSCIFLDGYLNSPPIINLPTNKVLQLRTCPFAAWAFCLRIGVLSSPFIVSSQAPSATSFCVIKFS